MAPPQISFLITDEDEYILLTCIESMTRLDNTQDQIIAALKDDFTIRVRTNSGVFHTVSMTQLLGKFKFDIPPSQMWDYLLRSWIYENE